MAARGLGKDFGSRSAVVSLDLDVPVGSFFGLVGPNGSGKTTLLRILVGLAAPSAGSLRVGLDRARLGYVGHEPLVYRDLTGLENLDLYGRLYRVAERRERTGMLLGRFGLWDARNHRVATYSRGMTQRLALCRALLHDPDLVVLDEPHTALDAEGGDLLDQELALLAGTATLVVSTHDPARVEPLATARLALGAA